MDALETKRPRHYVDEILQLETREERRAALQKVPVWCRQLVEHVVVNEFERQADIKRSILIIEQRGRYARQTGEPIGVCPYRRGIFAEAWKRGWENG